MLTRLGRTLGNRMSRSCPTTCHVMVLEDEVIVSSLLEMILQDNGWSVGGPFRTNRVALDYLEKARPDAAMQAVRYGESRPDDRVNVVDLAAWTMIANLLLNLDEMVTRG